LITGITGFVGGHLAEHLAAQGDAVIGSARNRVWRSGVPASVLEAAPVLAWDITQPPEDDFVEQVAAFQPDHIFHLAGISVPGDCGDWAPTDAALKANVHGLEHVAHLAQRLDSQPRLVFVSSCQVYTPLPQGASPSGADRLAAGAVNEDAERVPERGYGMTKVAAEDIVFGRVQEGSLNAVILRAFNHTGPRQAPRMMLPEWAAQLARGLDGPLKIISRDSHLDMTDVRDIVRAYRELALLGQSGLAYNVGSGSSIRSGDVLEMLLRRYDADVTIHERSPGRTQLPIADISRLNSVIDWRPEITLEQTIDDTLQYWMEQRL
jgi:GDP-4-dehydro-6-deoxy-D-mannose reductase